jgi:hypothetical protein
VISLDRIGQSWSRLRGPTFILGIAVLLFGSTSLLAEQLEVIRNGRLYTGPSSVDPWIRTLHESEIVTHQPSGDSDKYVHVRTAHGELGWVYGRFLAAVAAPTQPNPPSTGGTSSPIVGGSPGPLGDATAYAIPGCPPEGDAKKLSVKASNPLKNRMLAATPSEFHTVGLDAILAEGDDHDRWSSEDAAELVGYVYDVKPGGAETCNCHAEDKSNRDTHIELTPGPQDTAESRRIIVEVTPQWRRLMATAGKDWTTAGLRTSILHKYVKVKGWMFFDAEHEHQAQNTEPDGDGNWRATAWEVHPITSMEVVPHP